ncbi:MAG: DNA polymerase III subunit alpha [Epsilonproteobacteria bacterium]|nr:DNA polymerase III subunit alpha [Campylobacterota bacterium]
MSKHFTHLHLHTEYSLLDGMIKVPDLVRHAKTQEWKAVGISDHGNIFGAVKFFQLAKKEGLKAVLGAEMYFCPDITIKDAKNKYFHLILIVQNRVGYQNLCKLMAMSYEQGYYFKPRIDYAMLEKYSEGLISTTACVGGHIPSLLQEENYDEAQSRIEWFVDVFGRDRFYFELQPVTFEKQALANKLLFEYSAKNNINCIATSDAHYLCHDDKEAHEVLLSVQTKGLLSDPDRYSFGECQAYVRSTQEMLNAFPEREDLIWNTGKIADMCEFEFEFGKLFFPAFPVPEGYNEESFFTRQCQDGLQRLKNGNLIPADKHEVYDTRLKLEMDLLIKMGFVGYFLVVSDFIQWAKQQNISVGPGRGSGAGSLVAWAMQITNVDPIKYNLLFERFLNPERVSMPDFDIDFCINRREEVINYVKDKYGHDCVCQIITFGTMMAKGVIKDVARVLGFPFQDSNAITDLVPDQLKITIKEAIEQEPRLKSLIESNPEIGRLIDICFKLEGVTRHASKHAAGLVISPEPLAGCLPLYIPPKTHDLVAQYAMTELEAIGFLKMDFLGLKNLTVIDYALKAIKQNHGVTIDLDQLTLDDPKTFELLCKGQTKGVFQFESSGIQDVLCRLQPDKFEDLIAVNALYRPGPLGSGMVDDFIDRRHGKKEIVYMFPELEPILKETYGVIVYQEQVMKIAGAIAGYSLGAADILRRAMGKKKAEVMAEQKEKFVAGAKEKGFDEKKAAELFDLMAYFAGYGFNKSHSTAYALIAYHTAYLKANYPHEFMAALISFETHNPDQMTNYLQEMSDMHITVLPPSIAESEMSFTASKDGVRFGLEGIKNVGHAALENLITERGKKPFADMLDFCKRIDLRVANKRVLESLIYAGAFDSLPGNRAQKIAELDKIINMAQEYKKAAETGQMGLFGGGVQVHENEQGQRYTFALLDDFPDKEKLEKEKEVVGFYLSSHPLKSYPVVKWLEHTPFAKTLELLENITSLREPTVTCCGLAQSHKVITTKKGDRMAFMQCEDFSGHAEIIIFPSLFAKVEQLLDEHNVFVIKGNLDITAQNKCKIKAQELIPIDSLLDEQNTKQHVTLTLPRQPSQRTLEKIKALCQQQGSGSPLTLRFHENENLLALHAQKKISYSIDQLKELEQEGIAISMIL